VPFAKSIEDRRKNYLNHDLPKPQNHDLPKREKMFAKHEVSPGPNFAGAGVSLYNISGRLPM
jgi:hypothetical protein